MNKPSTSAHAPEPSDNRVTASKPVSTPDVVRAAVSRHPRRYEDNRYVYPVLSRRSKGISVGVNVNPDKICNFDCIYCQVDRRVAPQYRDVDLDVLADELRMLLAGAKEGNLFERAPLAGIPEPLRRVNDIAFSGDGEPTSYPGFGEAVRRAVAIRDEMGLYDVKIVVITNATLFHRPAVRDAFAFLDGHNGEIWAKLDAGTAAYYRTIERTRIPFDRIVRNIREAALLRPVVIQSLFMRIAGEPPTEREIEAYCGVLSGIVGSGGTIKLVQVYTVARMPAETYVTPLSDVEMDRLGETVKTRTGLPVEVYYGVAV
ncbi:MAG: radical SAM protein [candidate division Zixibacteria bacterium]|nr:radical SAM protein [candidate division Zixibacteria bacterium]